MPNAPKTPHKTIRIDPELWLAAQIVAKSKGETVTDVIRRALEDYTANSPVQVGRHDSQSDNRFDPIRLYPLANRGQG